MKKYLLGLFAIGLAITFSAFTKPAKFVNLKKFAYNQSVGFAKADVEDATLWSEISTPSCASSTVKACVIELDADAGMSIYYHLQGGSLILNTQGYVDGTPDPNDRAAVIVAEQGSGATGIFRVKAAGTTATNIDNRD